MLKRRNGEIMDEILRNKIMLYLQKEFTVLPRYSQDMAGEIVEIVEQHMLQTSK